MDIEIMVREVTHDDLHPKSSKSGPSRSQSGRTSITSGSSGSSRKSWSRGLAIQPFGFESKTSYDATEALLLTRSDSFKVKPPPPDDDIWKRPPPDFRPQNFAPKPPKRNSRESQQPWKYGTFPGHKGMTKRPKVVHLPHILRPSAPEEQPFVTRFPDIPGPYEAKLQMCKDGIHKPGPYESPKPHDFRGYPSLEQLGLDEFEVAYEKDPYNIHFHSRNLNTIHGLNARPLSGSQHHGIQMAPPKTPQPEWEARLILDKEPWPRKSASYTRHRRRGRTAHSALMDRVEDTLSAQWAKEKLDQQIQLQQQT